MKKVIVGCFVAIFISGCAARVQTPAPPPKDPIKGILEDRIDVYKKSVGIVVGIIDKNERRIIAHGTMDTKSGKPVDGNTIYEIGSITKVFTALLLADMSLKGEVDLNDTIDKYLPAGISTPGDYHQKITLKHLTTHTSGLPRMPDNFTPEDDNNPYSDYSVDQMLDFLKNHKLTRAVGEKYEYSNYGVGLLGYLLSRISGKSYEELLVSRISEPLGLKDTRISISGERKNRLATGHNAGNVAVSNWDIPALTGAGAIGSTMNDLLDFLAAVMEPENTSFSDAVKFTQSDWIDTGSPDLQIGMGWHKLKKGENEIIWHNGGTGGYHSFMGFDPAKKKAVAVLSNSMNAIEDIGYHIFDPDSPLQRLSPPREEKEISTEVYKDYVGEYELAPQVIIAITTRDDKLFAQVTGQQSFQIYPESESKFFLKVVDAQITFERNNEGIVDHLLMHQSGISQKAEKRKEPGVSLNERKEVKLGHEVLNKYVGEYSLAPNVDITVTPGNDTLMVQLTGQQSIPVYAESETNFFYKVVNARIEFKIKDSGEVEGLTLFQYGRELFAKRK